MEGVYWFCFHYYNFLKSHVMKIPSLFSPRSQVALLLSGSEQPGPPVGTQSKSHILRQALSWGPGGASSPQAFSVSCGMLPEARTCTGPLVALSWCLSETIPALLSTCLPAPLASHTVPHSPACCLLCHRLGAKMFFHLGLSGSAFGVLKL